MKSEVKEKINDILLLISWRQFARVYFGKSSGWLYHKFDGIDGFSEEERREFKDNLLTLAGQIRRCAERI